MEEDDDLAPPKSLQKISIKEKIKRRKAGSEGLMYNLFHNRQEGESEGGLREAGIKGGSEGRQGRK